jgi:AcrR family transcriptional regulator
MSAARLPRGRHDLTRDQVVESQRRRMLAATAQAMTELGYVGTPVAEIIRRAGVSRETFYEQFSSKQDCFIAALEDTMARLADVLRDGTGSAGRPIERFDGMLRAYLAALGGDPATARLFLIETYAAGPEAMRRRVELQRQFVDGIAALFHARSKQDRFACEALVGAIISLVTTRFVGERVDDLPALRGPLVALARTLLAG